MTQLAVRRTIPSFSAQRTLPFSPWPHFEAEEIEAVSSVLRSGKVNYWTGEQGRQFEREFAHSVGASHALCVASGTAALELALFALGIGPGDEVITPARTFFASASCIVMRGARPVCADVDPESQNVTAQTIQRVITPRTRAMIVVHLAGWPCEMDAILALAKERDLRVIEDCAQAPRRHVQRQASWLDGRRGSFFFLPGQDHDHRRRRRHAGYQRPRHLVSRLELSETTAKVTRLSTPRITSLVFVGCMIHLEPIGA